MKDRGVEVAVSGWGYLYEENKGNSEEPRCFTAAEGPEVFKECLDWFMYDGFAESTDASTGCQKIEPPSFNQKECQQLHKQKPSAKRQLAIIDVDGVRNVWKKIVSTSLHISSIQFKTFLMWRHIIRIGDCFRNLPIFDHICFMVKYQKKNKQVGPTP